jgi:hypothetical protein
MRSSKPTSGESGRFICPIETVARVTSGLPVNHPERESRSYFSAS